MFPFSTGCGSAWLERSVRDAEAARSNRAIPTKKSKTPQAQNLRRILHQASKRFGALHGWLYTKDRGKRFLQAVILFLRQTRDDAHRPWRRPLPVGAACRMLGQGGQKVRQEDI